MPEQFVDIEKIPGAAAEIENARTRGIIGSQLTHPLQIDSDPMFEIEIFGRRIAWIVHRVFPPDFFEALGVD